MATKRRTKASPARKAPSRPVRFTGALLLQRRRRRGLAAGPDRKGSPFDEAIERRWADIWLLYANTTRFASAMGCGGDYGVFANGRYEMNKAIAEMQDWFDLRQALLRPKTP